MTTPGFLGIYTEQGVTLELANNARTLAYLQRGLGGPQFETVTGSPCPDLTTEAWGNTVCAVGSGKDQLYVNPCPTYRVPQTNIALPTPTVFSNPTWKEAGYLTLSPTGLTAGGGFLLPSQPYVEQRVRLYMTLQSIPTVNRTLLIAKVANPGAGAANLCYFGVRLSMDPSPSWVLSFEGVASGVALVQSPFVNLPMLNAFPVGTVVNMPLCLEGIFTATTMSVTLYDGDPEAIGTTILGTAATVLNGAPQPTVLAAVGGGSIQSVFGGATEIGVVPYSAGNGAEFGATELQVTEIDVLPNPSCTSFADLYPSDTLWPSDDVYPSLYGVFLDPGIDNAPWIDVDRPEGYGYLGLLIDKIDGLDGTSTRSVDSAADGIGGILGPETLDPRNVTVTGWMIANSCNAMEYARRWMEDTLAGSFCAGCTSTGLVVRTTCGDEPSGGNFYTNRWTLYDVGLTNFQTDMSGGADCCFYTPVTFQLSAADPFLYGPITNNVPATFLNIGGADASAISFETWLFSQGTQVCASVTDQGIGIDAPIFTFSGGSSGIEAGLAYQSMGLYPSDSIFPGDCIYPADGVDQWSNDACPFVFSLSIGPGETFIVDNSRRRLQWILSDGTVLDGSPKLNLSAGDAIDWIDSCAGTSIQACAVATAGCSCDDTALVQIDTQHRER